LAEAGGNSRGYSSDNPDNEGQVPELRQVRFGKMSLYNNPFQRRFYKMVLRLLLLLVTNLTDSTGRSRLQEQDITEAWRLIDEL
jgi:hypothetical protein